MSSGETEVPMSVLSGPVLMEIGLGMREGARNLIERHAPHAKSLVDIACGAGG